MLSAPVGVGPGVAAAACAAGAGAGSAWTLLGFMTAAKLKVGLVVATTAGLLSTLIVHRHWLASLRAENAGLHQQLSALTEPPAASHSPATGTDQAEELQRLRREHSELLRLRGEVSLLRHEAKRPASAPAGSAAQPPAEKKTGGSPLRTFSANLRSNVPSGGTLVTGGWSTKPGKRTLVLLMPRVLDSTETTPSVLLEAKLFEATDDALAAIGLDLYKAEGEETSRAGLLTAEESGALAKLLGETAGIDVLAGPRIQTGDGQQGQVFVGQMRQLNDADPAVPVGISVDMTPRISADRESVELTVLAQINQVEQEGAEDRSTVAAP